jgi:hypothetical protein
LDCGIQFILTILSDQVCGFGSDSIDFEELFKELFLCHVFKGKIDDGLFIIIQMRIQKEITFPFFTGIKNLNTPGSIPQNEGGSVLFYSPVKEV